MGGGDRDRGGGGRGATAVDAGHVLIFWGAPRRTPGSSVLVGVDWVVGLGDGESGSGQKQAGGSAPSSIEVRQLWAVHGPRGRGQ